MRQLLPKSVIAALVCCSVMSAQTANTTTTPPSTEPLSNSLPAKKVETNPIGAVATVKQSVTVSAGLLTPSSASQLFGGWIAQHFLVVQVTIGNQSREQQFVLHDIFLDYSDWGLSGIYTISPGTKSEGASGRPRFQQGNPVQDYESSDARGRISSIGALEMQEALKQNSVFSKRNFFVNGLVLIGASAGGFTFLGPTGFTQGVAGYSSSFLPALQKFWPDRRIDQQANVLKFGFQDKMVIAKEDPGKTYAFFPIERMLTKGLVKVYQDDPAIFLNLAELFVDPRLTSQKKRDQLRNGKEHELLTTVEDLLKKKLGVPPATSQYELHAQLLLDLFSPCYYGENNPAGNDTSCELSWSNPDQQKHLAEIRDAKDFIGRLSLNTVRVVVSGIMTVDVSLVPSVLTDIIVDDPSQASSVWEDTSKEHTGVIHGKYLLNGTPQISSIKLQSATGSTPVNLALPSTPSEPSDYFNNITVDHEQSTDSELHFKFKLRKPVPPGTILSFQVARSSKRSVNDPGTANTQETTTSMKLDYTVFYTSKPANTADPGALRIETCQVDKDADLLKAGKVNGHCTGHNLDSKTLEIKSVTLPDAKVIGPASAGLKIDKAKSPASDAATLYFTLTLTNGLRAKTKIVLQVTGKTSDGPTQTVPSDPIVVPDK